MFGWLKSLFGSEPVKEVVIPPLPKVKKVAKKAEKPAAKPAAKKAATKAKAAKAPAKKEVVAPVTDAPVVEVTPVVDAPKKKGGRPKKSEKKVG